MTGFKQRLQGNEKIWSMMISIVFLSFSFVYILLRIDPKLIYQSQEPVFFFDRQFIKDFFSYPGGISGLFSSLLSQFYYHSWTGALLLVLIFWCVASMTRRLLRSFGTATPIHYLPWIPAALLLALHSHNKYPLAFTVGLLAALAGITIFLRCAPEKTLWRFLFYLLMHLTLYYLIAGQVLLFSLTIILYERLRFRRRVLPFLYFVIAALTPYFAASFLFILSTQDAYLSQLMFVGQVKATGLTWMLYGFFLLLPLYGIFEGNVRGQTDKSDTVWLKFVVHPSLAMRLLQGLVLLIMTGLLAWRSFDKSRNAFLRVDYYARTGEWEQVIEIAKQGYSAMNFVQYQANRALYHLGRLGDDLFTLRQLYGSEGLFLRDKMLFSFPLQHGDLFFDLGLINESEHWAHEAATVHGYTPANLQRLILVNLVKKNRDVAARYLDMLKKTMWHRGWAIAHEKYLDEKSDILTNPSYEYLAGAMPRSDFLVSPVEPERCLEELLKVGSNKMAFEYYMAHCLLKGEIGQFMKHLHLVNQFDYVKLPRHFQEAILVYLSVLGREDALPASGNISREIMQQFADFNKILTKYNKNAQTAYKELLKYRDTYWFYALYYYKAKEE